MSPSRRIVVLGDLVLDRDLVGRVDRVCPDAPVPVVDVETEVGGPGGAGLTALLCAQPDVEVTLVAPVGADASGGVVRQGLTIAGVHLVALEQSGPTRRKTRVRSQGQSLLRLDDGGPSAPSGALPGAAIEAVERADVVLVSCYGGGTTHHPQVRSRLAAVAGHRPVVWDPHPRGGDPVPGCALVTPNLVEARAAAGMPGGHGDDVARALLGAWSARAVCVTQGDTGAWLAARAGEPVHVPTTPVAGDACGAGDAFVAAAACAMARGRTTSESVADAVEAAREWVAKGGTSGHRAGLDSHDPRDPREPQGSRDSRAPAGGSQRSPSQPGRDGGEQSGLELARRVRALGGRLVATGGCFDILHAGHISCLQAARNLGDALVVLLNSDESVRRLKGPGRPVQAARDRARVLLGLSCVDAVMVFDESGPETALERLRPDVWVKGGDYEGADLPEAALVRGWGGRVVLIPYQAGYSTTAILADSRDRVSALESPRTGVAR